ncbi:MAG: acyltransferase [Cytophagales bacterium]|nr:acyltransferase [Cytophagales bacterium]
MPKSNKHIYALDFLRGFSSIWITVAHFSCKNEGYLHNDDILYVISIHGGMGVYIFFMISGFIIPYTLHHSGYHISEYPKFIIKRIIRLDPPYLFNIALILFLNYFIYDMVGYSNAFKPDILTVAYHIGYLNAFFDKPWLNPVFWTLAVEFQYYLILGAIFPLTAGRFWQFSAVFFALIFINFISDYRVLFFSYSIFFAIGMLFFRLYNGMDNKYLTYILFFASLCAVYIKYSHVELITVAFTYALIFIINLNYSYFKFWGDISYGVYLLHVPIGNKIVRFSQNYTSGVWQRSGMILLSLAVTIGVAYITYLYIEKPFINYSKKIKYKKNIA